MSKNVTNKSKYFNFINKFIDALNDSSLKLQKNEIYYELYYKMYNGRHAMLYNLFKFSIEIICEILNKLIDALNKRKLSFYNHLLDKDNNITIFLILSKIYFDYKNEDIYNVIKKIEFRNYYLLGNDCLYLINVIGNKELLSIFKILFEKKVSIELNLRIESIINKCLYSQSLKFIKFIYSQDLDFDFIGSTFKNPIYTSFHLCYCADSNDKNKYKELQKIFNFIVDFYLKKNILMFYQYDDYKNTIFHKIFNCLGNMDSKDCNLKKNKTNNHNLNSDTTNSNTINTTNSTNSINSPNSPNSINSTNSTNSINSANSTKSTNTINSINILVEFLKRIDNIIKIDYSAINIYIENVSYFVVKFIFKCFKSKIILEHLKNTKFIEIISKNTIHFLPENELKKLEKLSKKDNYFLDLYNNCRLFTKEYYISDINIPIIDQEHDINYNISNNNIIDGTLIYFGLLLKKYANIATIPIIKNKFAFIDSNLISEYDKIYKLILDLPIPNILPFIIQWEQSDKFFICSKLSDCIKEIIKKKEKKFIILILTKKILFDGEYIVEQNIVDKDSSLIHVILLIYFCEENTWYIFDPSGKYESTNDYMYGTLSLLFNEISSPKIVYSNILVQQFVDARHFFDHPYNLQNDPVGYCSYILLWYIEIILSNYKKNMNIIDLLNKTTDHVLVKSSSFRNYMRNYAHYLENMKVDYYKSLNNKKDFTKINQMYFHIKDYDFYKTLEYSQIIKELFKHLFVSDE